MENSIEVILIYFLIFMLGSCFGSFISALVYRRVKGISIISPPSFCDYCGKKILKRDLVPVFSFLFLRGRNRCCGQKISIDKVLVEIIGGLVFVFTFKTYGLIEGTYLAAVLLLCLLISVTDYKFLEIYDIDLKILIGSGVIYRLMVYGIDLSFILYCLIFTLGFKLLMVISKGGLGDGDLFFYLGLIFFLGNSQIPLLVLFSIWIGAAFAIAKAIRLRSLKGSIALCPAISLAFFLILVFRDYL